jgi:hypothetical protein
MVDQYESRRSRKKRSSARERREARQQRRNMAVRADETPRRGTEAAGKAAQTVDQLLLALRDAGWYLRNNPLVWRGTVALLAAVGLIYFLTTMLSGNIMPRVSAMGIDVGGMSSADAETALRDAWRDNIRVSLIVQGERLIQIEPDSMGIVFDAGATTKAAKDAGLSAFPLGKSIEPVLNFDRLTAQNFLLDYSTEIDYAPQNARYTLANGQIEGVPGSRGRMIDVPLTLERLQFNLADVVEQRRLEVVITVLEPSVSDPAIYLDEVNALIDVETGIEIKGYDPYANEFFTWPIAASDYVSWLMATGNGLTLREDEFLPYVDLLSETLNPPGENLRYLEPTETTNLMRDYLTDQDKELNLRIRYRETVYEVQPNDSAFGIARKMGIPYFLVEEANQDKDLNILSIGDQIRIPSRDVTMLEQPVVDKRIVVDLDEQYMVAYENNEVVFEWEISSGVANAPTSPGIYQILNKDEVAYGSSNTLCDDVTLICGQWEMNWFMGIYEVVPGLVNGFHGAVLLPNGTYLGGGSVGFPTTFGCVMSSDDQAKMLYDWAEIGTVVEIISNEYEPYSDLAKITKMRLNT